MAWMGRTALELVGQGMMGYSFDPLTEEVRNDFAEAIKSFVCVFQLSHPQLPNSPPVCVCVCAQDADLLSRTARLSPPSSGHGCLYRSR